MVGPSTAQNGFPKLDSIVANTSSSELASVTKTRFENELDVQVP